jgi:DNA-binding transcriptional ArsR family regulator
MQFSEVLQDTEELTEATRILKVLAEPNRVHILSELMIRESCNCVLNEKLGMPSNLLSHHLRTLSDVKLITSRRDSNDGRWIYYSVDRESVSRWQTWLSEFLNPARIQFRPLCGPEGQPCTEELSGSSGSIS